MLPEMDNNEWDRRSLEKARWERLEKNLQENTRLTMELSKVMAVHCEGELATKEKIEDLRTDVYGNGKKGLKRDVSDMKNDLRWVWRIITFAWGITVMFVSLNWSNILSWIRRVI